MNANKELLPEKLKKVAAPGEEAVRRSPGRSGRLQPGPGSGSGKGRRAPGDWTRRRSSGASRMRLMMMDGPQCAVRPLGHHHHHHHWCFPS